MKVTQRRMHIRIFLAVVIVALALSSCRSQKYGALLDTPPCWHDICPDVSTKDEAATQLEALEFVGDLWYDDFNNEIHWNFSDAGGFGTVVYDEEQVVGSIEVLFTWPTPTFEISKLFGVPPKAIAFVGCDYGDLAVGLSVALFYPDTNTIITLATQRYRDEPGDTQEIMLSERLGIATIAYHSSASYTDWLKRYSDLVDTTDNLPADVKDGVTKLYLEKGCSW